MKKVKPQEHFLKDEDSPSPQGIRSIHETENENIGKPDCLAFPLPTFPWCGEKEDPGSSTLPGVTVRRCGAERGGPDCALFRAIQ